MSKVSINEIAGAVIMTAKKDDQIGRVIDDLRLFAEVLAMNPSLTHLLQDGLIDFEKRLQALDKAAGDSLHAYSKNAIAILMQNNLLDEFSGFIQAVETQARELAKHYECTVSTAVDIDDKTIKKIKSALEKKWQGTVRIQTTIDKQIIGGLAIKCGDWHYQSTIQSKLKQLHNHLALN